MVSPREVRDLLDERPDLEPAVETVLAADPPWTFDDVDVDSGRFGELVSQGVVEKDADGYRVADPAAVRAALDGDVAEEAAVGREFDVDVDRRVAAALAGALVLVAVLRLVAWPAVFRDGAVVLSSNDPYYYLYWTETLVSDPTVTAGSLPSRVAGGEPLLVFVLAVVTRLVGGVDAAPAVLAWYPVVTAVATGGLVYLLSRVLTDDRRVALAAVVMFAVVPAHALRTGLGFADHHAFDYPWLVLTAAALAALYAERGVDRRTGLAAVGLGLGVTGQTLAWEAGPLLLAPAGLVVAVAAVLDVRAGRDPLDRAPVAAGVGLGAALTLAAHAALGWHATLVAASPALLFAGVVAVLGAGTAVHRLGLPAWSLAAGEVAGLVAGPLLLSVVAPDWWALARQRVTSLLFRERGIAETVGLFGDSFGWLLLFGFVLVVALPYAAWAFARSRRDRRWLVPATYAAVTLVLAATQMRFAGELAPFAALFAGLGFVHLAERVDIARRPRPLGGDATSFTVPDSRGLAYLFALFLLVGGLGVVQVPIKTSQVTIDEGQYRASTTMAEYADERGLAGQEAYVLSRWSFNRHYNYFVTGDSDSYAYARNNFEPFVATRNTTKAYEDIGSRVGFVVTHDAGYPEASVGSRLHDAYGSIQQQGRIPALSHYRAIYASPDGGYKAFAVVPGAVVRGQAEPGSPVGFETQVQIPGASFTYRTITTANESGVYTARVPYPGTYDLVGVNGTVTVPESAVENGTTVRV